MKYNLFVGVLILSVSALSQKFSCSNLKQKHFNQKSNTLTVHQIKLTEKYDVKYYELNLNMTNTSTYLSGNSVMIAKTVEVIDTILFELHQQLNISDIKLNNTSLPFTRVASVVIIETNLSENQEFKIQVFYEGTPPDASTNPLGGSGMTNDTSPSWGNQVTWSLSEPFSAFEWFPVKQSLKDKADSCAVNITIPSTCKAGSNGKLIDIVDNGNGTNTYRWKHNHLIDYYLISVAVAEYIDYSIYANPANSNPILIQNYIYNNPQTLSYFQNDIDETADFIELFSELFGLYPFADEKYGHCMAPLGGGMEHQTMTTQGSFDKNLTSHELAHQWWGDLVTCRSWADIWVNEGFASYGAYLMLENLYPNEKDQDMLDKHNNVMSQPDGSIYVIDSLNSSRIFSGRLTYDKGAAFIHTLRYLVNNDSLFFKGMRNYLQTYSHNSAIGLDFKEVLENTSFTNLNEAFEQWYFGEGYPTYNVTWNYENNLLSLKIEQSVSAGNITPLFTTPLEIKCRKSNFADTIIKVNISNQTTIISIPTSYPIVNVLGIDPYNWIINGQGEIVKDINFHANTSITENIKNNLVVFPNPTKNILTIEGIDYKNSNFVLIQTDGKAIPIENKKSIDLSNFSSGTYVLFIKDNATNLEYRKIIIKQ